MEILFELLFQLIFEVVGQAVFEALFELLGRTATATHADLLGRGERSWKWRIVSYALLVAVAAPLGCGAVGSPTERRHSACGSR